MQRRTVAVYAAFFLLVGVASYGLIATADTPEVQFEDPDFSLVEGDEFEVDGQVYTVTDLTRTEEEDDLGDVQVTYDATIEWTVADAEQQAVWENGTVIERADGEYEVLVDVDAGEFTLQEVLDREAILADDPAADNETVERDGEEYVAIEADDDVEFVPADEYFPAPQELQFGVGDAVESSGHTATVDAVDADGVTVSWTADETRSTSVSQGAEETFGDTQFIAHFTGEDADLRLTLTSDIETYEAQLEEIDQYEQHVLGLWYVTIVAFLMVISMVALAYLPSRY